MTPSQLFAAIKALFEAKELRAVLVPLSVAAASYANNPTAINGMLQLMNLEQAIIAAQPDILQSELKLIADDIASVAASLSAQAAAKAAAAATPWPPAAVAAPA